MKILIVLLLVLFLASLWDFKKGKIPNLLIIVGFLYGLMRVFYYQNLFRHIPGILFPILLLYPLFKIGTIGAGDIKLLSVIGLYISFMESIYCMFLAFVIGAIFSILRMKKEGNLADRISYLISYLKTSYTQKKFRYYYTDFLENENFGAEINRTRIHMAIPIFISVFLHLGGGFI